MMLDAHAMDIIGQLIQQLREDIEKINHAIASLEQLRDLPFAILSTPFLIIQENYPGHVDFIISDVGIGRTPCGVK